VTGATPSQKVQLLASRTNVPTTLNISGCGAVNFGIGFGGGTGIVRFGTTGATQFGDGSIDRKIPAGVSGSTLHFQAFDAASCTVSNVISFPFP